MPSEIRDLSRLCLHTITTRPWGIEDCIRNYSESGIHAVTLWRNVLANKNLCTIRTMLGDYGMKVVSLCRGGFFPSIEESVRIRALDDNLLAIEQARAIGAPMIVLVCGSDCRQSLEKSREQIAEGIFRILPAARSAGIRLAVEPLHPMYAADRSAINTLRQANDVVEMINSDYVGVAVDVYHLWWDSSLETEIKRSGAMNRLFAFHVSDWKLPLGDILNDRGIMGEGCINIPGIRSWMESAGFEGFHEVEIFSERHWASDQWQFLRNIINAYMTKT
jgi:sugar phosphate isomerase/epimerase